MRSELKKMQLQLNSLSVVQQKSKQLRKGDSEEVNDVPDASKEEEAEVSKDIPDAIKKQEAEISKYGRKYAIMASPWSDIADFEDMNGRPDVDPYSPERYKDEKSMIAGTKAELYDFVPTALHSTMERHSRFRSVVCVHYFKLLAS